MLYRVMKERESKSSVERGFRAASRLSATEEGVPAVQAIRRRLNSEHTLN